MTREHLCSSIQVLSVNILPYNRHRERDVRRKIAFWICPVLKSEVAALQSGNTKVVLENGRLLDEIAAYRLERMRGIVFSRIADASHSQSAVTQRP